jgi:hypothetical protein
VGGGARAVAVAVLVADVDEQSLVDGNREHAEVVARGR